jgi:hypothetical protein
MNNAHEIKYPIVAFAKGGVIHFAKNEADLTICSKRGLKNGFYNGLNIIDSEGNCFDIQGARKVGYAGFLWGFSLKYGQRMQVELIFMGSNKDLSIENFKERILKQLKKDKHFWNSGGNFNELVVMINSEKSFKRIITYLTNYCYKKS